MAMLMPVPRADLLVQTKGGGGGWGRARVSVCLEVLFVELGYNSGLFGISWSARDEHLTVRSGQETERQRDRNIYRTPSRGMRYK